MARILKERSHNLLIDLDDNVGVNGTNGRVDVGSVQQVLRLLSSGTSGPVGRVGGGFFDPPDGGSLTVDGFYGPQTANYIDAYQNQRQGLPSPSGAGMPAPDGTIVAIRKGGGWNFGVLNGDLQGQNQTSILDAFTNDITLPPFLKAAFFLF